MPSTPPSAHGGPSPAAITDSADAAPRCAAVVLAAGLGTRMRSALPKVLHPVCGQPMLGYVLDAARAATGSVPVVVTSPATGRIRDVFGDAVEYALQDVPRGTGDA